MLWPVQSWRYLITHQVGNPRFSGRTWKLPCSVRGMPSQIRCRALDKSCDPNPAHNTFHLENRPAVVCFKVCCRCPRPNPPHILNPRTSANFWACVANIVRLQYHTWIANIPIIQCLPNMLQVDSALGTAESTARAENSGKSWSMCSKDCDL